jgi:hypothetical protein
MKLTEFLIRVLSMGLRERGLIEMVTEEPLSIRYMHNPSVNVQLAVVRKNPLYIEYIENPAPIVQAAAVNSNSESIHRIKHPTDEVSMLAKLSG